MIQKDKEYTHKNSGRKYKVVLISDVKIDEEWKPCVIYTDINNIRTWVRLEADFKQKFVS